MRAAAAPIHRDGEWWGWWTWRGTCHSSTGRGWGGKDACGAGVDQSLTVVQRENRENKRSAPQAAAVPFPRWFLVASPTTHPQSLPDFFRVPAVWHAYLPHTRCHGSWGPDLRAPLVWAKPPPPADQICPLIVHNARPLERPGASRPPPHRGRGGGGGTRDRRVWALRPHAARGGRREPQRRRFVDRPATRGATPVTTGDVGHRCQSRFFFVPDAPKSGCMAADPPARCVASLLQSRRAAWRVTGSSPGLDIRGVARGQSGALSAPTPLATPRDTRTCERPWMKLRRKEPSTGRQDHPRTASRAQLGCSRPRLAGTHLPITAGHGKPPPSHKRRGGGPNPWPRSLSCCWWLGAHQSCPHAVGGMRTTGTQKWWCKSERAKK